MGPSANGPSIAGLFHFFGAARSPNQSAVCQFPAPPFFISNRKKAGGVMLVKSATVAPGHGQDQTGRSARKSSRVIKDERPGLTFERFFTRQGVDPFETVEWERRDAVISGADGKVFFEQRGVEFPKLWSQTATNVVVQKYFRGTLGTPEREHSVRQMIARVADTIYGWGKADGYFKTEQDAWAFRDELVHLLLHQKMAFNSPVWFNVGVEEHPQCSACFINSVDDSMTSILTL